MDTASRLSLAQSIKRTHDLHEQSYRDKRYTLSLADAVDKALVPADERTIVLCLLTPGYAEVFEWVKDQLNPYGSDVSS